MEECKYNKKQRHNNTVLTRVPYGFVRGIAPAGLASSIGSRFNISC